MTTYLPKIKKFKPRRTDPLECKIEQAVCAYAKSKGIEHRKFKTPNRHSAPDQLFLLGDERVRFIEFKRKGEKPTPGQLREHATLAELGYVVRVIDNIEAGKRLIDQWVMLFK